jgi:hypothetical protein
MDPDCRNEETTVDLCSEPECINSTIAFEEADRKTHLPTHGMFKVHRLIFDRDMARVENLAKDALNSARGTVAQLKREEKPMLECVRCKTAVSLPCWCCVECTGERESDTIAETSLTLAIVHARREVHLRRLRTQTNRFQCDAHEDAYDCESLREAGGKGTLDGRSDAPG